MNDLEVMLKNEQEKNLELLNKVDSLEDDIKFGYSLNLLGILSITIHSKIMMKRYYLTQDSTHVYFLKHYNYVYVKPYLNQLSALTAFQQLLVTLIRLRLNLSGQDLAYCFKLHSSTTTEHSSLLLIYYPLSCSV